MKPKYYNEISPIQKSVSKKRDVVQEKKKMCV